MQNEINSLNAFDFSRYTENQLPRLVDAFEEITSHFNTRERLREVSDLTLSIIVDIVVRLFTNPRFGFGFGLRLQL